MGITQVININKKGGGGVVEYVIKENRVNKPLVMHKGRLSNNQLITTCYPVSWLLLAGANKAFSKIKIIKINLSLK